MIYTCKSPGYRTYSSLTYQRYSPMPMNPYTLLLQTTFLSMIYLRLDPCNVDFLSGGYIPTTVFQSTLEFSCIAATIHFHLQPKTKPMHPCTKIVLFSLLSAGHKGIIPWWHRSDLRERHQCNDHGGSHGGLDNLLIKLTCAYWTCFSPVQEAPLLSYDGFLLDMPNLRTWWVW